MVTLRKVLSWLLGTAILAVLLSVVGQWFIEVAQDKGLYEGAGQRWDWLYGFVTSDVVLYPLTALTGLVAGLWLKDLLARMQRKNEPATPPPVPFEWEYLEQEVNRAMTLLAGNRHGNSLVDKAKGEEPKIWHETANSVFGIIIYLTRRKAVSPDILAAFQEAQLEEFIDLAEHVFSAIGPLVRMRDESAIPGIMGLAVKSWQGELEAENETHDVANRA